MNSRLYDVPISRLVPLSPPATAAALLLLAALTLRAGSPYTATGWVIGTPVPGIWRSSALGSPEIRGNAHLVRVESSDLRATGRRTMFLNAGTQADGSSLLYGTAYQEVGTWDLTGTDFIPSGGMWESTYRGTMAEDGSLRLHVLGCGWGGTVDGLRIEETLTRPAGDLFDPAIPYQCAGTIKPPSAGTTVVIDDFSGPAVGWSYWGPAAHSYTRIDGQLVVRGSWHVVTRSVMDSYTFGGSLRNAQTVDSGETLEARVDLVSLNESATAARVVLGDGYRLYGVFMGHGFMALNKWSDKEANPGRDVIMFFYEETSLPQTGVIPALALTRVGSDTLLTVRVLDRANPSSVLYTRSVVDTPRADPVLTSAELEALSGMSLSLCTDVPEPSMTGSTAAIGVFQYNYDGNQPAAEAVFDNLELWKYEAPAAEIGLAVQLSWPALPGLRWIVESAPSLEGPWGPVEDTPMPGMEQRAVPATELMRFFRLQLAP